MGGDTDRARCRLGRVRMLMRGEFYCRPKGQHNAQARYPLRYRPHDGYPMEAFFESIPKRQTNATRSKFRLSPSITCVWHGAVQPRGLGDLRDNHPSLHDCQRRNKTETCCRAPLRVHATNKKGEHAATKSQKHNGYDEGHSLPHDELASRNGS